MREYTWDPMKWHLPIPPRVADAMDVAQQWAVACTREALEDYGYPKRPLDLDRTAVILGNAMAGEKHYLSSVRIFFPEYAHELADTASFAEFAGGDAASYPERVPGSYRPALCAHHRRHHAWRAGQLHGRTHRKSLQLSRA